MEVGGRVTPRAVTEDARSDDLTGNMVWLLSIA